MLCVVEANVKQLRAHTEFNLKGEILVKKGAIASASSLGNGEVRIAFFSGYERLTLEEPNYAVYDLDEEYVMKYMSEVPKTGMIFVATKDIDLDRDCVIPKDTRGVIFPPQQCPNVMFDKKDLTITGLPEGAIPLYSLGHFDVGDYTTETPQQFAAWEWWKGLHQAAPDEAARQDLIAHKGWIFSSFYEGWKACYELLRGPQMGEGAWEYLCELAKTEGVIDE